MSISRVTDTNSVYWKKIITGQIPESDVVELFLARVAAFRNIASEDEKTSDTGK